MRKILFSFLFFLFTSGLAMAGQVVEEIVARVGNEIITKSEYDKEAQRLYEDFSSRLKGDDLEKQYQESKKNLLTLMVNQKLLE